MTKVKAHTSAEDIRSGAATHADRFGNSWADALAVAGAKLHKHARRGPPEVHAAMAVQRMMIDIGLERLEAIRTQGESCGRSEDCSAEVGPRSVCSSEGSNSSSEDERSSASSTASASSSSSGRWQRRRRKAGRSAPDAPD